MTWAREDCRSWRDYLQLVISWRGRFQFISQPESFLGGMCRMVFRCDDDLKRWWHTPSPIICLACVSGGRAVGLDLPLIKAAPRRQQNREEGNSWSYSCCNVQINDSDAVTWELRPEEHLKDPVSHNTGTKSVLKCKRDSQGSGCCLLGHSFKAFKNIFLLYTHSSGWVLHKLWISALPTLEML